MRAGACRAIISRYLFVRFDPMRDQWRRSYRMRGIAGLIAASNARPLPLPECVVEIQRRA
jgi:hypothetical protein